MELPSVLTKRYGAFNGATWLGIGVAGIGLGLGVQWLMKRRNIGQATTDPETIEYTLPPGWIDEGGGAYIPPVIQGPRGPQGPPGRPYDPFARKTKPTLQPPEIDPTYTGDRVGVSIVPIFGGGTGSGEIPPPNPPNFGLL